MGNASSSSDNLDINSLITAITNSKDTSEDLREALVDLKNSLTAPIDLLPDIITDLLCIVTLILLIGVIVVLYNLSYRLIETRGEIREGKN